MFYLQTQALLDKVQCVCVWCMSLINVDYCLIINIVGGKRISRRGELKPGSIECFIASASSRNESICTREHYFRLAYSLACQLSILHSRRERKWRVCASLRRTNRRCRCTAKLEPSARLPAVKFHKEKICDKGDQNDQYPGAHGSDP